VRLLFDQNLSDRLPIRLNDLYVDAMHVAMVGLERASDDEVWRYARDRVCIIVAKHSDFAI
jgi:predicted nuclease of predicted toxin-antitoxin system